MGSWDGMAETQASVMVQVGLRAEPVEREILRYA